MAIKPYVLDRRVTLLRSGSSKDKYGDRVEGFAPIRDVWASVKPGPGTERLANAENAANAVTVITIRWAPDLAELNPKDRVEYPVGSGRQWDIKSAFDIGRRQYIQLAAQRRADQ